VAWRRQVRIDRAEQARIERAAILVAGDARADLALAAGQDLPWQVRIGDERARHADEVSAAGERCLHVTLVAEGLADNQRHVDVRPQAGYVLEQRRSLCRHVSHVRCPDADREIDVVDEPFDVGQERAQRIEVETGLVGASDRQPHAEQPPRSGRAHDLEEPLQQVATALEVGGARADVRGGGKELAHEIAVGGVQLHAVEPRVDGVHRRRAVALDQNLDLGIGERPRRGRLAR
jgi:hypothetical protein